MPWSRASFCIGWLLAAGCAGADAVEPATASRWAALKREIRAHAPDVDHVGTETVRRALVSARPPLLVDTRSRAEFEVSHLPGAIHVPHDAAAEVWQSRVPPGRPVIVYCSVGYRSADAARALAAARPGLVQNYLGSIFEWANEGHPLEGAGPPGDRRVHPYDDDWGRLLRASRRADLPGRPAPERRHD